MQQFQVRNSLSEIGLERNAALASEMGHYPVRVFRIRNAEIVSSVLAGSPDLVAGKYLRRGSSGLDEMLATLLDLDQPAMLEYEHQIAAL